MRTRIVLGMLAMAAALASSPTLAAEQQDVVRTWQLGSVDFGLRFTDFTGDEARFQRFRDIGDGAFLDRLRFEREGNGWFLDLGADHVGRRDQRFFGTYQNPKLKVSFLWDQIPLFISADTRTLYSTESPGVLRIDDAVQQGIESGQLKLSDVTGLATPLDTRSRRDTAEFNLLYSLTRDVDMKFKVKTAGREGTMPWGATFGFSDLVEVQAPLDTRTTDLSAKLEWANSRGSLRVGYDGSWFSNKIQTLIWDNPLKLTDSTTATPFSAGTVNGQGRLALWPDSTLQSVSASGWLKLAGRSRLSGTLSLGAWRQDQPLLPFTINTAIPAIPLERTTAEAEARTLAMNYVFTSRPNNYLWLNARYRYYDFDNRTPEFSAEHRVRLDQAVAELEHGSEALGQRRHTLDFDASFTPLRFTALKVGYTREQTDRTFRIFARTTEDVFRTSIDTTGNRWVTVRAIFEHSARQGSDFDPEPLEEAGEQPAMWHFDIADRDRNRVSAVVQVTPAKAVGFTATVGAGKDDYKNSGFGLRDNQNRIYSITADVLPRNEVAFGASYTYERYSALQNSRNASPGPQFDDPLRNWSTDSNDKVHTVGASLDLLKLLPKTELRLGYDFSRSRATYVYNLVPGSVLVVPQQLPPVRNELHSATVDMRYFLTAKIAVGLIYWYDRYAVDDFALGPGTINRIDLPGSLFLGYVYRPYTANSVWARLTYLPSSVPMNDPARRIIRLT